ncbi:DUF6252 family protein [Flavobacterium sp.]|uniref:DUF6252 family protein n=1 Tax=Flavobacterium sp. TaxID=239 RepID=UPI0039E356DA
MKKIVAFIVLAFALGSCSEDIKFNNQAVFQGVKDNLFWKGTDAKAVVSIGAETLTVSSTTLIETMTLDVPLPATFVNPKNDATYVTYALGTSLDRTAHYVLNLDGGEYIYRTAIGIGDGEVVITEYDGVNVSGTFRFNAINEDSESEAPETVNVQSGVFYKVPVVQTP